MDELIPYLFSSSEDAADAPAPVRVIMRGGATWFVAGDVCRALDIKQATRAVANLDEDEKGVSIIHTLGGDQQVLTVSESGLYALIFRSRKPVARKFRRWVTEEVLPSIRRTGHYEGTVPVGRHPQGPSISLPPFTAFLHDHQLRVLNLLHRLSTPIAGAEDPVTNLPSFGHLADLAGLSVENVRRCVRLFFELGLVSIRDPATEKLITTEPAGQA